jgi:hypothetical protein
MKQDTTSREIFTEAERTDFHNAREVKKEWQMVREI